MAEHSMCHPGRPGPQGEGHDGSPSLAGFLHRTEAGDQTTFESRGSPETTRAHTARNS